MYSGLSGLFKKVFHNNTSAKANQERLITAKLLAFHRQTGRRFNEAVEVYLCRGSEENLINSEAAER